MTMVDVGANVGLYTLVAAQAVGRNGRVVAFEPDPRSIIDLRANVDASGFSNVTIIEAAASSAAGTSEFHLRHASGHSGLYKDEAFEATITVPLVSIDESIVGSVDVVKIDAQGAEVEVLAGMSAILRRSPGIRMLIEFYPRGLEAAGHSEEQLAELLRSHFDKIAWIDSEARTLRAAQKIKLPPGRTFGNLYCERGMT
jgi:FkbM family methyltransferase